MSTRAPRRLDRRRPMRWLQAAILVLSASLALGASCAPKGVEILSPVHGSFSTASSILVEGEIQGLDPAAVTLTVNGVTVPVQPDRSWSTTISLDLLEVFNPIFAKLTVDASGKTFVARSVVIAGDSIAQDDFALESIALRLNDSGVDSIEPLVTSLVDLDIASLLPAGTVVINDFCAIDGGFLGCLGAVDVAIANPPPTFDSFGLNVDAMSGFAAGDVFINGVEVNVDINGSGLAPSCGLRLTASSASILGDYSLEPDAADATLIDVNLLGMPGISFANFSEQFTSGLCDFPLIGDLIQLIIGDVEPIVRDGLVDFLSDPDGAGPADAPLAEGIETALADIAIAGPIGESLGVSLEAPLFLVAEDGGGITLGSDSRIQTSVGTGPGQCDPPEGAPDLSATLAIPEPFPPFGTTTPISNLPYGLGICVSTSAFNQLLAAEIECGLLQTTLTELDLSGSGFPVPITAGLLAALVPEFGGFDPLTEFEIDLTPTLAPVLTGSPGPQGEIAELRVGGLDVVIRFADSGGSPLSGQIDFRAGLDFSFDNGTGSLVPSIASVQAQDITVAITNNVIGTNPDAVAFLLQNLLPLLLPTLGDSLGSFPLPSFLGLDLQAVAVEQNGEFLSLFFDLTTGP